MLSLILAQKILSMFVIMAMGFALVRTHVVSSEDSRGVSLATLYVISPCMIVSAFQMEMTHDVASGFVLALGAGLLVQVLFWLLSVVCLSSTPWSGPRSSTPTLGTSSCPSWS